MEVEEEKRKGRVRSVVRLYRGKYSDYVLCMETVLAIYFGGAEHGKSPQMTRIIDGLVI